MTEAGFDVSLSYALTVDHGVVQSYEMAPGGRYPAGAARLNTAAPPLPAMARCVLLGDALGAAIRAADYGGGCWSSPAVACRTGCPPTTRATLSVDPQRRGVGDPWPQGRRASPPPGNPGCARWAVTRTPTSTRRGTPGSSSGCTPGTSSRSPRWATTDWRRTAGSGGHEIRTWLTGMAAVRKPLVWTSYEPVPEWITGMGIGTTFAVT